MERQWALVTGASSGIGFEYARVLAAKGYPLLIVSNEEMKLKDKAVVLEQQYGVEVDPLYMDLSDTQAAYCLQKYCHEKNRQVEILVNNAGMFYFGEFLHCPAVKMERMLQLHVMTPTLLCRLFGEEMKQRRHGYILNMSSLSAWTPYPGIALYAATKRYLKNFSRAFRSEVYDYGIGVTWMCPGAVATDLYHLSHRLQRLAVRLGIMMSPEKLAQQGIKAMFRHRRMVMPGIVNYIFLPLVLVLPAGLVRWGMRKSGLLPLQYE